MLNVRRTAWWEEFNLTQTVSFLLSSERARPLRFICVGGSTAVLQMATLMVLVHHGLHAMIANSLAILLAIEVNFVLSSTFTWRHRRTGHPLVRRWIIFHLSMAMATVLNMSIFALTSPFLPLLVASATGIVAGAVVNFVIGDRLIFAAARATHHSA